MEKAYHQSSSNWKFIYLQLGKTGLRCLLVLLFISLFDLTAFACGGSPAPPCGRSVFLAKFTPGVVVFPAAGAPINVPIGVLPFAQWNNAGAPLLPICPQPTAATLTLTLNCAPSGIMIGPQNFVVPVPTAPGPQPLAGPVNFVIPAGTFPAGSPPQICTVVGVYSVTFSDGVTLSFTGDTEVCIVDPSPLNDTVPRLDMQYIPVDGELYRTCRRGDQANFYFLLANNDPNNAVSLDLNSIGRQVAGLPDGVSEQEAYANDVFSISFPQAGTDTYAAAFVDDLTPGQILNEPDPFAVDPQMLTRSINLQPLEATIISIAMRSYGMCANGSCNERLLTASGTFANGDSALACASTLYVVGEAPGKSSLCEFSDSLKVGGNSAAVWSPGTFANISGPIQHAQTFFAGNLPNRGFQTSGDSIPDNFPSAAVDFLRVNQNPAVFTYLVEYNSSQCFQGINQVQVVGLDNPNPNPISIPAIGAFEIREPIDIILDINSNQLMVGSLNEPLFSGPFDQFLENPPSGFCVDRNICRTIQKRASLLDKTVFVDPSAHARLIQIPTSDPGCNTGNVIATFNGQMGVQAPWTATVSGPGLSLPNSSGTFTIEYCFDQVDQLPKVPQTTISYLNVSCDFAINNPVRVPIAIRVWDTTEIVSIDPTLHQQFVLHQPFPNPFAEGTNISFSLDKAVQVELKIFNHLGQEVRMLHNNDRSFVGKHSIAWDGTDDEGHRLDAGVYFCRMDAGGVIQTRKLILID